MTSTEEFVLEDENVLVTGGAGFVGSHLIDKLVAEGYKVTVLDDLSSGNINNIRGHISRRNLRFLEGDLRRYADVEKAVTDADLVCHLAAKVSVSTSIQEPLLTHEVNTTGTLNLLRASVLCEVRRFVFLSSSAVYGETKYLPIDENHPTTPLSPYAASKLAGEQYCAAFHHAYGVKTVILRMFNVYGSRQKAGVVPQFVRYLQNGDPPVIYGTGEQTRDFLYVRDAVDAVMLAQTHSNAIGQVFNIGTGKETTINELARVLREVLGVESKPVHTEPRKGEVTQSCADINKAEGTLGYKPQFSLEKGLSDFLDHRIKN